jgi:ribosomal protein S18 acetylase RimI-like enzyme
VNAAPPPPTDSAATLAEITALQVRARALEPVGGLYDAGDPQWWWCTHEVRAVEFLRGGAGAADGCLLVLARRGRLFGEVLWAADAAPRPLEAFLRRSVARVRALARETGAPARVGTRADDARLRGLLEAAGFAEAGGEGQLQLALRADAAPPLAPLPSEVEVVSRAEAPDGPHPLARRNGPHVEERLRACPHYDAHLDLRLRIRATGECAGYCLGWLDTANAIGALEPVRIEDAFRGRGLGKALVGRCTAALAARGAALLKVAHEERSAAAARLYAATGFARLFAKAFYDVAP